MSSRSSARTRAIEPDQAIAPIHAFFAMMVLVCLVLLTMPVKAQSNLPLVTPQWLEENRKSDGLRILDLQSPQGYQRAHIEGAVNTSYAQWRQPNGTGLKKMLPDQAYLEALIGTLGIKADTHVVLAPIGINPSEVAVATRIYWTFKTLGHEKVSILNGGLIAYSQLPNAKFVTEPFAPAPTSYKAKLNMAMAPNGDDVNRAWKKGAVLVDSRSEDEYTGKVAAPGERAGTIPDSRFLPFDRLVEKKGQYFQFPSKDKLTSLYEQHNVPTSGEQISFCHTGHRTSLSWFVSHELLGNKDAKLYDGSIAEWGKRDDLPMAKPK